MTANSTINIQCVGLHVVVKQVFVVCLLSSCRRTLYHWGRRQGRRKFWLCYNCNNNMFSPRHHWIFILFYIYIYIYIPRRGYGTLLWWRGLRESRTTATIPKTFNDIGKAQSETPDEDHVQPNASNSHWASAEGMAHPFLSWVTPKNKYRSFLLGQRI